MTNFADRTIWPGDYLGILRDLNSESVDIVYLDPPFNSNRNYVALDMNRFSRHPVFRPP